MPETGHPKLLNQDNLEYHDSPLREAGKLHGPKAPVETLTTACPNHIILHGAIICITSITCHEPIIMKLSTRHNPTLYANPATSLSISRDNLHAPSLQLKQQSEHARPFPIILLCLLVLPCLEDTYNDAMSLDDIPCAVFGSFAGLVDVARPLLPLVGPRLHRSRADSSTRSQELSRQHPYPDAQWCRHKRSD